MPRTSKIAKLPPALRDEVNERLERSDTAASITEWLNALPEVQKILKASFKGDPINDQNITNWRRSGFAGWLLRRDFMDQLLILSDEASDIAAADLDNLTAHASRLLAIRFALLLSPSSSSSYSFSSSTPSTPTNEPSPIPFGNDQPQTGELTHSNDLSQSSIFHVKNLCLMTRAIVALRRADTARVKMLAGKDEEPATLTDLMQEFAEIRNRKGRHRPERESSPAESSPPAAPPSTPAPENSLTPSSPDSPTPVSLAPAPPHPSNINQVIPTNPPNAPTPARPDISINQVIPTYPSDSIAIPVPVPMDPDKGDLTPGYARWLLKTQPLDTCRERYLLRERYLPKDVQAALNACPSS